jgi:MFS transporter, CP family, cyanate transporter
MPPEAPSQAEAPSHVRWLILFGVWVCYFSFGLTAIGLAPLVGPITRDLAMSHSQMGTVLGIWQLVYIGAAVPGGALLDRLGPRRAVFIGAFIVAISAALRAFAGDFLSLCLAVGLFGIGGPIVSAGAPKVISLWFRGRDRGMAMGIYITGPAVGGIIGLSLTNSVLMPWFAGDWRQVLLVWAVAALLGSFLWLLVSAHPVARRLDRKLAAEPRAPQAAVIRSLLRLSQVQILLVMSIGIFMLNHGLNAWLPELLRSNGMSVVEAGYWATIPTVVGIAGSLVVPRLATPERRFGILALLAGGAGLATALLHADAGAWLMLGVVLQGFARSSLMTVAMLTLVETRGVGEKHAGTAGGLFFSAAEIGGAGGPMLLGALYDATGGFAAGLNILTLIAAALLLGIAALARAAKREAA